MSAATAPGVVGGSWRPTPPQRGSFPLDHDKECSHVMTQYLECLKLVKGTNAPGCRMLAKSYLKCRMDHDLMDQDDWKNLGLPEDAKKPEAMSATKPTDSDTKPDTKPTNSVTKAVTKSESSS